MLLCTCSLAAAAASTTATEPAADIRNWVAQSRTPPKQSSATQLQDLQALQPLAAALGSAFAKVDGSDFASAAAKVLDGDDVGTYVRSQFEAKSGLTSAWLDGMPGSVKGAPAGRC